MSPKSAAMLQTAKRAELPSRADTRAVVDRAIRKARQKAVGTWESLARPNTATSPWERTDTLPSDATTRAPADS
jgi:hypothetical protein